MPRLKILNALVVFSAVVAIYANHSGYHPLFSLLKPLTTILVIAIPFFFQSQSYPKYSRLITIGLFFCLAGDIFLLWEAYFVFGLGAFLIGHILFIFAFVSVGGWKKYPLPLLIIGGIGLGYYWYLYPDLQELAIPVLLYFVCILLMCWQGIGLYLWQKQPAFLMVAIASILFHSRML